jgi:hypothetical protein
MAEKDGERRGVPEAAPSERVLAEQVEDVLSAIRAEIGDEEEPVEGRNRRLSRPSIPDVLAAAIVFVEPSSPVDAWARGEDLPPADDHDDFREILHAREAERPPDESSADLLAERDAPHVESAPPEIDTTEIDSDEDGGPATLRPSEVSFHKASRRRPMWWAAVVPVAAVGGLLAWKLAPESAPEMALRGLSEGVAAPVIQEAPRSGSLSLTVSAEGAQIMVDGEPRDGTRAIDLAPGTHALRVEAPGYHPHERRITVEAGATAALGEIVLEAMVHRVIIEVDPTSAYVMITRSGELSGRRYAAPWPRIVEVEPGHYTVVAFRNGLETVLRPVEVRPGSDPVAVRIRLPSKDIYD